MSPDQGVVQDASLPDRPPPTAMRAARIEGPGRARVISAPRPAPGPGEVLVRMEGCGVCASNLGPWAGPEWMSFPTEAGALGHEGWGVVEAVGPGAVGPPVGSRVATLSSKSFAEFDVCPAASVVPLPEELRGAAFPGEALGCAFNIFRRSEVRAGQTVAVVGLGFLGLILTRLSALAGARVIGISRRETSLALGRRYGAADLVPMDDHWRIIETVKELTGGRLCDRVIEAVGKQWPLDLAGELCAERGRLVIAGYHQDGPRSVNLQLWNWRGLDVVNAHERDPEIYARGVREAVDAVLAGRLELEPLLTHSFPLEELGAALDATRDKPDGFVKAVVLL